MTGEVETEVHFLLQCEKYSDIRETYFGKFTNLIPGFQNLCEQELLSVLLGQQGQTAALAAKYVTECHTVRDSG